MEGEQLVPLATYEQPLWPSVGRGAKMSMLVPDGIKATLIDERMSRSVLFEADDAGVALKALHEIQAHMHLLQEVVATSSRFARLIDLHAQIAGNLLFLRFELTTGDASGHNMVTLASERLMDFILRRWPELRYESISGNFAPTRRRPPSTAFWAAARTSSPSSCSRDAPSSGGCGRHPRRSRS